jgi:Tfp pilus assembly protein PilN
VPFSIMLQELSLVIPENVRLTNLNATVPDAMLPGAAAQSGTSGGASADVTLIGDTDTHRDVAEFMTRLGLIPQLMDITLTSSTQSATTSNSSATSVPVVYMTFTITAKLRPYATKPPTTKLGQVTP